MTLENEKRANSFIPDASGDRVVTCDEFTDSECDRSQIKKVTSDEKEDTPNSARHAQEKINSSDVDSSDDENVPLLELKKISCQKQDIRQVENPLNLVCYADSTSEETKSNGEGDKTNIDQIIERLQDNEDRESPPMSMEEYRLTYTKEFLETAIDDEQNIIKETRNLVDPDIYSQSDTTATRGTSDCDNDSSDSEPEIVIYRNKNNSQKKKKKVTDHVVAKYLVSGQKFGFPLRKLLSDELKEKCVKQDWCAIEIKSGLKEGRGVFAKKCIKKITPLCNYGRVQVSQSYAEKHLLPHNEKCNYLVELLERTSCGMELFYMNCDSKRDKTYGQLINHSALHPNAIPRTYVTEKGKLEIIFCSQRDIKSGEEILWDYGKNYNGVEPCMESCTKCKNAVNKA